MKTTKRLPKMFAMSVSLLVAGQMMTIVACGDNSKNQKLQLRNGATNKKQPANKNSKGALGKNQNTRSKLTPPKPGSINSAARTPLLIEAVALKPYNSLCSRSSQSNRQTECSRLEMVYLEEQSAVSKKAVDPRQPQTKPTRLVQLPTWITCIEKVQHAPAVDYNGIILPLGSSIILQRSTSQQAINPQARGLQSPFVRFFCTKDGKVPSKKVAAPTMVDMNADTRFETKVLQKDKIDFVAGVNIQLDQQYMIRWIKEYQESDQSTSFQNQYNFGPRNLTRSHNTSVGCYRKSGYIEQIYHEMKQNFPGIHVMPGSQVIVSRRHWQNVENSEKLTDMDIIKRLDAELESERDNSNNPVEFSYFICLNDRTIKETQSEASSQSKAKDNSTESNKNSKKSQGQTRSQT